MVLSEVNKFLHELEKAELEVSHHMNDFNIGYADYYTFIYYFVEYFSQIFIYYIFYILFLYIY